MNCAVVGGGSFGITITKHLFEKGSRVKLWEFDPAAFKRLSEKREDALKLPGAVLDPEILVTNQIDDLWEETELTVFAIPSQFVRSVIRSASVVDFSSQIVVNVAKGIEINTLRRVSEVLQEENSSISSRNYVMLSGPSHAEEVVRKVPTTIVAASENAGAAEQVQTLFSSPALRVYTNSDVTGVELAGALKNIIALAAGIADGLGFGDNTKGALLTRGMVEITRLGLAMGARQETFFGLSGMGDLITTCTSRHSRNRRVGEAIGKGQTLDQVLAEMTMVAEGVETTRSAYALAEKYGVEMPITRQIHEVLFENRKPQEAIGELMVRELKPEGI